MRITGKWVELGKKKHPEGSIQIQKNQIRLIYAYMQILPLKLMIMKLQSIDSQRSTIKGTEGDRQRSVRIENRIDNYGWETRNGLLNGEGEKSEEQGMEYGIRQ